ncbi:MAG: antitoxin family protein [Nitrospirae bacterium]|nr:antitoxin family protein [Nitrospirota bacterium]
MSKTIEAIYENGVLKPLEDIGIEEHKKVRIILIELTEGIREYSSDEIDEFLREDRLDKETASFI